MPRSSRQTAFMRGWRGCNFRAPDFPNKCCIAGATFTDARTLPAGTLLRPSCRRQREAMMPYRRGGFALTPPSVFIFLISLAFALVAMLVYYTHTPVQIINTSHVFDLLAIAYVVLTIGVLFRRV
jgi:hypothetical protein